MSDVNKVRSNTGIQYGFEDTVARQRAEEAIAKAKTLSIEGDTLVISTSSSDDQTSTEENNA